MGKGLRFVQNDMGKGLRFVQNDMGRGCASFRMTWLGTAPRCHSECDLSFRARSVIPSASRNLITSRWGCRIRFFTPLRFVQNDMAGGCVPFRMTWVGAACRAEGSAPMSTQPNLHHASVSGWRIMHNFPRVLTYAQAQYHRRSLAALTSFPRRRALQRTERPSSQTGVPK